MRRLLPLLLLLTLATPAGAEEDYLIQSLGDGWYRVMLTAPVVLSEGQWAVQVKIWLDDVPGGFQGIPSPIVQIAEGPHGAQRKAHLVLSQVGFMPVGPAPYVTLSLQDTRAVPEPGTYRLGVVVRGRE